MTSIPKSNGLTHIFFTVGDDSDYFDRSAEISEIDERLSRLQLLMKTSLS